MPLQPAAARSSQPRLTPAGPAAVTAAATAHAAKEKSGEGFLHPLPGSTRGGATATVVCPASAVASSGATDDAERSGRLQELKFAIAEAQPTPWIQNVWIQGVGCASAETIICAVK